MREVGLSGNKKVAVKEKKMANSGKAAVKKAYEPLVVRAIEVIGDESKALRWLGTPVRALDYATPISLLSTPKGEESVLAVLDQFAHGVF